jgi:hypothetical protein
VVVRGAAGLLVDEEIVELKTVAEPGWMLWAWSAVEVQSAVNSKVLKLSAPQASRIYHEMMLARGSIQSLKTYISTQLPLPYVHLLIMLTKLFFVLLTLQVRSTVGLRSRPA